MPASINGILGKLSIILKSSVGLLSLPKNLKILSAGFFLNIIENISFPVFSPEIITSNNVLSYHWKVFSLKVILGLGGSTASSLAKFSLYFFEQTEKYIHY